MAVCVSMTALPADVRAAEDGAVQTESTQAMETSSAEEAAVTEEASETEMMRRKHHPNQRQRKRGSLPRRKPE